MANRLFLRVAGIRGDFSDDSFIAELVSHMLGPSGRFPRREKQASTLDRKETENKARSDRLLWTFTGHPPENKFPWGSAGRLQIAEDREKYAPTKLETQTEQWLDKCQQQGRYRLPLTAATLHQWETDLAHDTRKGQRAQERAKAVFGKKDQ